MPTYRKLHTKTTESLDLNDMPDDFTRLMWVLLPLALCREGRGLHSGAWLKSKLFPLREDIDQEFVWTKFQWFVGRGMVVPYEVGGRCYFYVPTFHKYQGNTVKERESDYPPPPDVVQTNSEPTPELVQSKSVTDSIFNIQYSDADAEEIPAQDAGPPPDNGKPRTEHQEMFDALIDWLQWDVNILTRDQRGRINALSKRIRDGGYTPAQVTQAGATWYADDWRGQKGSRPANDKQLLEHLALIAKQEQADGFREVTGWQ